MMQTCGQDFDYLWSLHKDCRNNSVGSGHPTNGLHVG